MEAELQTEREEHANLELQLLDLRLEHAQGQPDHVGGPNAALAQSQKLVDNFKNWAPEGETGNALRQAATVLEAELGRHKAAAEAAAEKANQEAEEQAKQAAAASPQSAQAADMDVESDSQASAEARKKLA